MVILGIGHELRGDDAAGTVIAQILLAVAESGSPAQSPASHFLILNGGHAPESQTGPIRRFQPHLVLLVDAAFVGEEPGQIRLLRWQESTGLSATTHTMPPYMLAQYLVAELSCEVALLGIQPQRLDLVEGMSDPVRQAVDEVVEGIKSMMVSREA